MRALRRCPQVCWLSGVCSACFFQRFLSPRRVSTRDQNRHLTYHPCPPRTYPDPGLNSQPLKPCFESSSPSGRVGVSDTFPTLWTPRLLASGDVRATLSLFGPLTCTEVTLFWSHGSFQAQTSDFKIICAFRLSALRDPLIPHTCVSGIAALPKHTGNCGLSGHLIHGCCDERSRLCLGQRPDL